MLSLPSRSQVQYFRESERGQAFERLETELGESNMKLCMARSDLDDARSELEGAQEEKQAAVEETEKLESMLEKMQERLKEAKRAAKGKSPREGGQSPKDSALKKKVVELENMIRQGMGELQQRDMALEESERGREALEANESVLREEMQLKEVELQVARATVEQLCAEKKSREEKEANLCTELDSARDQKDVELATMAREHAQEQNRLEAALAGRDAEVARVCIELTSQRAEMQEQEQHLAKALLDKAKMKKMLRKFQAQAPVMDGKGGQEVPLSSSKAERSPRSRTNVRQRAKVNPPSPPPRGSPIESPDKKSRIPTPKGTPSRIPTPKGTPSRIPAPSRISTPKASKTSTLVSPAKPPSGSPAKAKPPRMVDVKKTAHTTCTTTSGITKWQRYLQDTNARGARRSISTSKGGHRHTKSFDSVKSRGKENMPKLEDEDMDNIEIIFG
jgi:hypothetical protein